MGCICTAQPGADGHPMHDPCVIAWLLQPDLFRGKQVHLSVETGSPLTMGQTVADWWGVETTRGVDEEEFIKKLTQRYSYHKVMEEIRKKGYTLEEEVSEDDTIQLRVRTWS